MIVYKTNRRQRNTMTNEAIVLEANKHTEAIDILVQNGAAVLNGLINDVVSLKTFVVGEIPDVIQQLLFWEMWKNLIMFFGAIAIIIAMIVLNIKQFKFWKDGKRFYEYGSLCTLNVLQFFLLIPIMMWFNLTWLKIMIAPKLYLIQYAAELFKK